MIQSKKFMPNISRKIKVPEKILKEAEQLLTNRKRLQEAAQIEDPFHPAGKAVAVAMQKVLDELEGPSPSPDLLWQIKHYWIPIANHFGMWQIRYRLEDGLFAALQPRNYKLVLSLLKKKEQMHQRLFQEVAAIISQALKKRGVKRFEILYRKKNVFGIYTKMERKHQNINQITDVFAIRVLLNTISECYKVLQALHDLWPPYLARFKDQIKSPKQNGYQSIHTTLHCLNQQTVEFQIRTRKMDEIAKYGLASHALYKKGLLPLPPPSSFFPSS